MYTWIWRKLPGGIPGKLAGCLLLFLAAVALLFFVIFPWAEPKLPWNHVNIREGSAPGASSTTPAPSATATTSR